MVLSFVSPVIDFCFSFSDSNFWETQVRKLDLFHIRVGRQTPEAIRMGGALRFVSVTHIQISQTHVPDAQASRSKVENSRPLRRRRSHRCHGDPGCLCLSDPHHMSPPAADRTTHMTL